MVEYLPDTNVGNIEYIRREDAVGAVEFGITLASAINTETGEWTELFQRENDELREAVKRIKDIKPADVAPYSVSPDGTLIITVPKGTTANRVLVEWEGTHCGGLYYAD